MHTTRATCETAFLLRLLWLALATCTVQSNPTPRLLLDHPKFVALNETDGKLIEGKYIVVFDSDRVAQSNAMDIESLVMTTLFGNRPASEKIQSRRFFRNALYAMAIEVEDEPTLTDKNKSDEMLLEARGRRFSLLLPWLNLDIISFIEEEQVITSYADQHFPPSWGLDRIDQNTTVLDQNYHYDQTGKGVTAYIVDTGIRSTHDDFGGRVTCGYNAFAESESCQDGNGHGTHVAGTVGGTRFGVAKEVDLVTIKVLNNDGAGSTASVLEGIDYVAEQGRTVGGPMVANLSLGGFRSPAINLAVGLGNFGDVFFAVAAGNEDHNACLSSPASSTLVTTVAATDRDDSRATFSNYGRCVDIFAPGVDIPSAWHTGDTDFNTISGTSMASPHVAGVAALYLQVEPDLTGTPLLLRQRIIDDALPGMVADPAASPNVLLSTEALFTTDVNAPPPGATNPDPLDRSQISSWAFTPSIWTAFFASFLAATFCQ